MRLESWVSLRWQVRQLWQKRGLLLWNWHFRLQESDGHFKQRLLQWWTLQKGTKRWRTLLRNQARCRIALSWQPIGSSPELSAFAASCRFRKVAWILVLQIPALLVQNKTHMVNMDEAPNFHKMLKPELKLNTCEAMVQKLLARKLLLFRCSMMASLVLFSLF